MFFPIRSFVLATTIYFFGLFFANKIINSKINYPEVSIEIDAEMIGNENIYEQNSKFVSGLQKISDLNHKNQVNDHQHLNDNNQNNQNESSKILDSNENLKAQKIPPIFQPLPEIPEDLRYQIFSTTITAKFYIDENGEVYEVELVNPSNIPKLNMILIKTLKRWRFPRKFQKFQQIINVEFIVEN